MARTPGHTAAIAVARAAVMPLPLRILPNKAWGGVNSAIQGIAELGHSKHVERNWQLTQLPNEIRELVTSALIGARFASVMRD